MTTLVIGASGATGKHLVNQLLVLGQEVKVIVRTAAKIPDNWKSNSSIHFIEANVSEINEDEMAKHLEGCNTVASCLGHNISWKGIFGKPRKLVTDSIQLISKAIKKNSAEEPIKLVLMSTTAFVNNALKEPNSFIQRIVIGLLRLLLPPHVDNEKVADFLINNIGQNNKFIQWVAVRPYNLINEDNICEYEVYPSPSKPAVLDPRKTRRINVGHFMAELITNDDIWDKWKGQLPIIIDKSASNKN